MRVVRVAGRGGERPRLVTQAPEPPSVVEVQRDLRALGYQVREAAGTLDDETRHAVVVDFTTQVYDASTNCSLC
ncbi:peptidoglycan-binding protein [Prauserella flavalba]|uniref:peptidoglycan-binding protein n=1 Tax=Prauserella flavalba TaxID=1477506 RepID=UPI0011B50FDC|nr:peptidoglycan-binding protein [Prauserella flavalba]